jgi:Ni/Co efflux regulator RcnB
MKRVLSAALALSLLGSSAALAQPNGDHHDNGGYSQGRDDHRDGDRGRDDRSRHDRGDRHDNGRHWARGQRLPPAYYQNRTYYVDYRAHHLRRPPSGYRWVQVDDNYALVAITSGLIASIIYGR